MDVPVLLFSFIAWTLIVLYQYGAALALRRAIGTSRNMQGLHAYTRLTWQTSCTVWGAVSATGAALLSTENATVWHAIVGAFTTVLVQGLLSLTLAQYFGFGADVTQHTPRALAFTVLGATAYWATFAIVLLTRDPNKLQWANLELVTKILAPVATVVGILAGLLAIKEKLKISRPEGE